MERALILVWNWFQLNLVIFFYEIIEDLIAYYYIIDSSNNYREKNHYRDFNILIGFKNLGFLGLI